MTDQIVRADPQSVPPPGVPPLYWLAALTLGEAMNLLEAALGELQTVEPKPAVEGQIRAFLSRFGYARPPV